MPSLWKLLAGWAPTSSPLPLRWRVFHVLLAFLTLSAFVAFTFYQLDYTWNWRAPLRYHTKFLQGWGNTIWISACSLVLSLIIGVSVALIQRGPILILRYLVRIYIETIRGTPLLVQILVLFYAVASSLGIHNRYLVGIFALALFSGSYIAEIIRAGIESIGQSQWESALAIGLTPFQTYRHVIFPQVIKRSLPPLAGQFASLVKDSSLLSLIAVSELTLNAREINTNTYSAFESYIPLALAYLLLTLPISLLTRYWEKKSHYDT